jgi:hypothetical protein
LGSNGRFQILPIIQANRIREKGDLLSGVGQSVLFLFRYVLDKDLGDIEGSIRASKKRRLPVVLTQQEVL